MNNYKTHPYLEVTLDSKYMNSKRQCVYLTEKNTTSLLQTNN